MTKSISRSTDSGEMTDKEILRDSTGNRLQLRSWIVEEINKLINSDIVEPMPDQLMDDVLAILESSVFYKIIEGRSYSRENVQDNITFMIDFIKNRWNIYLFQREHGNTRLLPKHLDIFKYTMIEGEKVAYSGNRPTYI